MKAKLIVLQMLLGAALAQAQTVPNLLSYQGRVTDAAGTLIGATAPVSRTVTFRLYSTSSAGTALYAETQTVTISGGEFSVLLGNGTGVTGSPGPSAPATTPFKTLSDIVNVAPPAALYLGITVDDGTAAVDPEISPRQQLVSGVYALRAKSAEGVAAGAISSTMLADSSVTTNQLNTSAVTSAKIADATIVAADLAAGAVTFDKLDTTTIGLWSPSGANIYRNSNVGIGLNNPGTALSFADSLGAKIALYSSNNATNQFGFGIQNNLLQMYAASSSSDIGFGTGSSTNFTELMRIRGNGNVGIGTAVPSDKLVVNGNIRASSASNPAIGAQDGTGNLVELGLATGAGAYSASAVAGDGVVRAINSKSLHLQSGAGGSAMTINSANQIGIGTTTPDGKMTISNGFLSFYNDVDRFNSGIFSGMAANDYWRIFGGGGNNNGALYIDTGDDGTEPIYFRQVAGPTAYTRMLIAANGFVGINQSNPIAPLHVGGGAFNTFSLQFYMDANSVLDRNENRGDLYHSIIADNRVRASAFDVASDIRIKTNLHPTVPSADLTTLLNIKITNYIYKDMIQNSSQPQKKVIAQQVETVYPQAVVKGQGVVPDIYKKATFKNGWVLLSTDLQVGERVRLISDKEQAVYEVLEVRAGAFRTDRPVIGDDVFVYGREVKDFRAVDYEAIAMLNVSATQELARQVAEKDARISALEARLNALEKRLPAAK